MKRIRISTLLLLIVIAALLVDRWRLARREEDMKLALMRRGVEFATYRARVAAGTVSQTAANPPVGGSPSIPATPGR